VASVRADRAFRKPVLNSENGYEYLRGHPTEKKQVHHTDKVRHSSWRIVCAGGYFAAGFNGTIGHSDAWNRIDATQRYTFSVASEGAAAQLARLYEFFTAQPFERMQPFEGIQGNAVALAEPGENYVIYLPQGGKVTVDLGAAPHQWNATWFNPRDGRSAQPSTVAGGQASEFQAPDELDWVLHLQAEAPSVRAAAGAERQ
jgi:hypothetical protein